MNSTLNISGKLLLLTLLFTSTGLVAGPGHDHGEAAPTTNAAKTSPRFEAHSDLFEAVGVLDVGELSIFIDRYSNNAPLLGAKVELESGALKTVAQFLAERETYVVASKSFENPGNYPITLTITAGEEVDILAGNLVVPDPHAGHDHAATAISWKLWIPLWVLAVVIGLAVTFVMRRRAGRVVHG